MTFQDEMKARAEDQNDYNNNICVDGVYGLLLIEYHIKNCNVLWIIMSEDYDVDQYSAYATEYGVTDDGRWAAVYDSHCSCNGYQAEASDVTYYDSLEQLLDADSKSIVIIKNKEAIEERYPFIKIEITVDMISNLVKKLDATEAELQRLQNRSKWVLHDLKKAFGSRFDECMDAIPSLWNLEKELC